MGPKNKQNPLSLACILVGLRCVGLAFGVKKWEWQGETPYAPVLGPKNKPNPLSVACVLLGLRCVGLAFGVKKWEWQG